ncbi:RagB/SusD family nutrient uptake outer membrane protein [Aridibaculum aurantiacum]|uniref:RagB/SusD family nutrient uptake outer membrane protein n=1 Tax=Aridibaculum aurantiacum TaxID=2810307 RepID=UPI001A96C0E0|nr:RagB/SusD family nutrient uptake outer membrane protein [Aridibaculum aurantiacum]
MKKNLYKLTFAATFLAVTFISGCRKQDSFFEIRDRGGLDAAIWDNEGAIQFSLNKAYDVIFPDFYYQYTANNYGIHMASDENYYSATDGNARRALGLQGTLVANDVRLVASKYQGATRGDNSYFDVARCNVAIANIPNSKVLSDDVKNRFLGQFYALRAMIYLELTKAYGGMPLVLEPQNPDNLTLAGRAKAREMFAQIVKDLDSSMNKLRGVRWVDATERGKISRAAAAGLKARALLYWASPQFNPNKAHERWVEAHKAAKEAYEICVAEGHQLMTKYEDIFRVEGPGNREAIMVKSYSDKIAKRNHGVEARSRPSSENGQPSDVYYPSTRMIDAYTMIDGRPITNNPNYDPMLFWKDRDPRFEATIAYNGSNWKLSGNTNRKQWTYNNAIGSNGINESNNRGFYVKRFSSPDLPFASVRVANDFGGSGMDWIEMRFAEIMLMYAETANEVNDIALAKSLVRDIRKRAGIIAGSMDYGLALANSQDAMRDLIMNERMVEFAFEGKRPDDLRRTRRMHTLSGTLQAMTFATRSNALKDFLERVIDPVNGTRYRETLNLNNKDTLTKYFVYPYPLITPANNTSFSVPEHYYFFGLSNQFMNSTPLLEQTIGWEGGTFDPLN